MQIFSSDTFILPLPEGHRFPISKYALLRQRVIESGIVPPHTLHIPHPATDTEILRSHTPAYLERIKNGAISQAEMRRIGFPWSLAMVERSRRSSGATIEACRAALADGFAVSLAGGTHHAYADHGEGFCVFNDSVIAARTMQAEQRVRQIVVIDCDVHQGNGTAAITVGDSTIFTFSIHGAKNYPFHKEQSDLDLALEDGTGDDQYLNTLEYGLHEALEHSRAELAIYLAGADPFEGDRLGRLKVSKAGLQERDRMVLEACRSSGLPVAITMAGGYGYHVEDTVEIHAQTVSLAAYYVR